MFSSGKGVSLLLKSMPVLIAGITSKIVFFTSLFWHEWQNKEAGIKRKKRYRNTDLLK
jgi:hypothetical protein